MGQEFQLRFVNCLARLGRDEPELAATIVPTGVTGFWAGSLDYPDWLTHGTDFPAAQDLPRAVRLIDDLQIIANLIGHAGERRLIELLLEWPRFPTQAESLAAPDLGTALEYLAGAITHRNALVSLAYHRDGREGRLTLRSDNRLGPFRSLLEAVVWVVIFRVARAFLGFRPSTANALDRIVIRSVHAAPLLAPLLDCEVSRSAGKASELLIDADVLGVANPEFDPESWHRLAPQERTQHPAAAMARDVREVVPILRDTLAEVGRVPQLAEIAARLEMSSRSFARAMADAGLSYRDLVNETRMVLARELLGEGRAPVKDIALQLGYGDVTAFVRAFRRSHGVPPTRWTQAAGTKK
jgi:AraC-like DNA-binding protein